MYNPEMARIQDDPHYAAFMEFMRPARPILAELDRLAKDDATLSDERVKLHTKLNTLSRDRNLSDKRQAELKKRDDDVRAKITNVINRRMQLRDEIETRYDDFAETVLNHGDDEARMFRMYKAKVAPIKNLSLLYPGRTVTRGPDGQFYIDGHPLHMGEDPEDMDVSDDEEDFPMGLGH